MIKAVRALLLLLFLGLVSTGYWLLGTESGLRWTFHRLQAVAGAGNVQAEHLQGHLAGTVHIRGLSLKTRTAQVRIRQLQFNWAPVALLWGTMKIQALDAEQVDVTLSEGAAPSSEEKPWTRLALPLAVTLRRGELRGLSIRRGLRQLPEVDRIVLSAHLGSGELELHQLSLYSSIGSLKLRGRAGLLPESPVALNLDYSATPASAQMPIAGTGKITGTLEHPRLKLQANTPFTASAQIEWHWLGQPFAWTASLKTEGLRAKQLNDAWPAVTLSGTAAGSGNAQSLQLSAGLSVRSADWGNWKSKVEVTRDGQSWRIPTFYMHSADGPAEIQGDARWQQVGDLTDISKGRVNVHWQAISWPPGKVRWSSPEGKFHIAGSLQGYQVAGTALVRDARLGDIHWQVSGSGDSKRLALNTVRVGVLNGTGQGTVRLRWRPSLSWSAHVDFAGLDPGVRWTRWKGQLGARITLEGVRTDEGVEASGRLENLKGRLRGQPVTGEAALRYSAGQLIIPNLEIGSGNARFEASGAVGQKWRLDWSLQAPALGDLVPEAAGSLSAKAQLRGPLRRPRVEADVSGRSIVWHDRRVSRMQVKIDLDLTGQNPWLLDVVASGLQLNTPVGLRTLRIKGRGTPGNHRVQIDSLLQDGAAHLAIVGGLKGRKWTGQLQDGRIELQKVAWTQEKPTLVAIGPGEARLDPWCWTHAGTAHLCLSAARLGTAWSSQLRLSNFPLQQLSPWLPRRDVVIAGTVDGQMSIASENGEVRQLDASLVSENGSFSYELPQGSLRNEYKRWTVSVEGKPEAGLSARAELQLQRGGHFSAQVQLPGWMPGMPVNMTQPLTGKADLDLQQTEWLTVLIPNVAVSGGAVAGELALAGEVGTPQLSGHAEFSGGSVILPALGISLHDIRVSVEPAKNAVARTEVSVRSGPGELRASGVLQSESEGNIWGWTGRLTGDRVEVMNLPLGRVLASPQLQVNLTPGRVQVSGQVRVPEAEINFQRLPTGTVQPSSDVVVVDRGQPTPAETPWQTVVNVEVIFGDKVQVRGHGFSGRLGGSVRIIEQPGQGPLAQGEVNILDGKYEAYGRKLSITEGRLFYASMPVDNPGLDFRAVRKLVDVTVGVTVSGRLQSPEIGLFSEPPMDQSDQLSYLILGRPLSAATQQEAGALQQAATSLGLAGGGRLARQIGEQTGLDVVEVGGTGEAGNQASLVLGKYLSPRLYVQYAIGILQAVNSVKVQYRLGRHWVLEATSGQQTSTDLLFTFEH